MFLVGEKNKTKKHATPMKEKKPMPWHEPRKNIFLLTHTLPQASPWISSEIVYVCNLYFFRSICKSFHFDFHLSFFLSHFCVNVVGLYCNRFRLPFLFDEKFGGKIDVRIRSEKHFCLYFFIHLLYIYYCIFHNTFNAYT